jgi:hypothetical protein
MLAALDRRLPHAMKGAGQQKMRRHIASATGDRYRESNRRTAELTTLDLSAYGYAL